jgi:hypothetical protein
MGIAAPPPSPTRARDLRARSGPLPSGEPEIERRGEGDDEADGDHHVHRRRVRKAEDEGRQHHPQACGERDPLLLLGIDKQGRKRHRRDHGGAEPGVRAGRAVSECE